jgi:hydrogenase maturation protein HypF
VRVEDLAQAVVARRRYRHAFASCTNCGPRLTLVCDAPYDRERTTMARFAMCSACRAEYEDPRDRRFHAQPIACPECGPRLVLLDAAGARVESPDAIASLARAILGGGIVAIKGLGGFHLVCDARSDRAIGELRRRKMRDEKPLAVMVADLAAAEAECELGPGARELLTSAPRPIVLLGRQGRGATGKVAAGVAPGSPRLGVMLPYTPLHHLLLGDLDGAPVVMTSGNRSDEPIAFEDDDAVERLSGIADLILLHDRPIRVRCDDSVAQVVGGVPSLVRRSRGYAPEPVRLPLGLARATLAVGGELKTTFALGQETRATVSHHVGDLHHLEAQRAFADAVAHYEKLFGVAPRRIVHDLHPDYASTQYAQERAAREGLELLGAQHHHAHVAGCMAERGLRGRALGVAFDGAGYGTDGAIWGGEVFSVEGGRFVREAHLAYVPQPGGDRAAREPWRMAVSHLVSAGCDPAQAGLAARIGREPIRAVVRMTERRLNAPLTSSVGRLFDAFASLVGICDRATFEGQAASALEALASEARVDPYAFDLHREGAGIAVDVRPLIRGAVNDLGRGVRAARVASRFHASLADIVAAVCERVRARTGVRDVVLSGGCFVNARLSADAAARLAEKGFRVFTHRQVPPNDGGISLGQLALCAALDAAEEG